MMSISKLRGFTLIEVLVALAVIGIAMAAAVRATVSVTDESITLRRHLAGSWVAQNRLNNYATHNEFPATGVRNGNVTEAGLDFAWRETVTETPNATFRRVEVRVMPPNNEHADAILIGYVANVPH